MRRKANDCPEGQFGPVYNVTGAALAKYRKREAGLASWSYEERQAYGAAVEAAILSSQASALRREVSLPAPNCASGTWINTNDGAIGDAIRAKQSASLRNCKSRIASLEPLALEAAYREAMPEGFIPSWEKPADLETQCAADPEAMAAKYLEAA